MNASGVLEGPLRRQRTARPTRDHVARNGMEKEGRREGTVLTT
jgi:hypothetical protein